MPLAWLDRPPRVLFCTDTYAPQMNGVSVVTAMSVRGLAEGCRVPDIMNKPLDEVRIVR